METHPYRITCRWNDGVIRTIDLEGFLKNKSGNPESSYFPLLNKNRFSEVKCDGTTLYWENGRTMRDTEGNDMSASLDIDPDILFEMTIRPAPSVSRRKREIV